eukprot:CAMPEP_0172665980 /NCGR_PEP_ID=MMETSP1074-20121228/7552_1 /TAXON_ID=2916 /ORGANISM="Ceratium fusus, Strain PA161109" /LENGTH=445 /DNA_ID=CAMNT_0013482335 /DNA_START=74 /DNA_END=1411 /DNA_ORIENTATION=+
MMAKGSRSSRKQLIIITTDHWTRTWFMKCLFPYSTRYNHLKEEDIVWVNIDGNRSFDENLKTLVDVLRFWGEDAQCHACSDPPMLYYSAAVEVLKDEINLTGANFLCNFLASNKLAARRNIKGFDGIKSVVVRSEDECIPDLTIDGFFKPIAGCGSKGVMKTKTGQKIENPLKGTLVDLAGASDAPKMLELASAYEELRPYLDNKLVGIVEEYMDPAKINVVAFDGFVFDKEVYHFAVLDNIYLEEKPEVLEYCIIPSSFVKKGSREEANGWKLFDTIANDLISRGLDNQFLCLEAFVLPDGRVEALELNCRTDCNPNAAYSVLFGPDGNDVFSAALDLVARRKPPLTPHSPFASGATAYTPPDTKGRYGVCAYYPPIENAPEFLLSDDKSTFFYHTTMDFPDHCFAAGTDLEATKQMCRDLYNQVKVKAGAPTPRPRSKSNEER